MSQDVTLHEQMGAMSLVDELRHRQMVVQDHLNLPERRTEIARRIREYYQSANLPFDEASIEAGVRKYFDRRLVFEAPVLSRWQSSLSSLYISREKWGRKAAMTVGAVAITVGVLFGVSRVIASVQIHDLQQQVDQVIVKRDEQSQLTARLRAGLAQLAKRQVDSPLQAVTRISQDVQGKLDAFSPALKVPAQISISTFDHDASLAAAAQSQLFAQQAVLSQCESLLTLAGGVLDARDLLSQVTDSDDFKSASRKFSILKMLQLDALAAMDVADTRPIAATVVPVHLVRDKLQVSKQVNAMSVELQSIEDEFRSMKLTEADLLMAEAIVGGVRLSIQDLDQARSAKELAQARSSLAFAKTPLQLNIVDRQGVKSGVERTYNASKGKSWFLVIEATDSKGAVVPVPVKSAETGDKANAPLFAVRVSEDEYKRVKADKIQDGHIDDKAMGVKPANAFTLKFNGRTTTTPDVILKW